MRSFPESKRSTSSCVWVWPKPPPPPSRHGEDPTAAIQALREESKSLQQERKTLLVQAGYQEDDLVDRPGLPLLQRHRLAWGDHVRVPEKALRRGADPIPVLPVGFQGQSFDTFSLDYYSPSPGPSGVSPRSHMEMVRDICYNYASRFGRIGIRNLFLSGNPGLGKTFLSACIAQVVSEAGFSVVYDTAIQIFSRFEEEKFGRSEAGRCPALPDLRPAHLGRPGQ